MKSCQRSARAELSDVTTKITSSNWNFSQSSYAKNILEIKWLGVTHSAGAARVVSRVSCTTADMSRSGRILDTCHDDLSSCDFIDTGILSRQSKCSMLPDVITTTVCETRNLNIIEIVHKSYHKDREPYAFESSPSLSSEPRWRQSHQFVRVEEPSQPDVLWRGGCRAGCACSIVPRSPSPSRRGEAASSKVKQILEKRSCRAIRCD